MGAFETSNLPFWGEERPGKASMTPEGEAAVRRHAGFTGKVVESRNWWRRAFFATLPVLGVLGGANAWLAIDKSPVEVFAIPVFQDGEIGDVIKGGNFSPDGRIVGQRLLHWVKWIRVVSPDRTLMGDGIEDALAMTTERGANMLREIYSRDPDGLPMAWPEEKARTVEDVEVTEESANTFSIAWRETVYSHANAVGTQRFRGTIVVRRIDYGDDPQAFLKNPTGAFVDTVSWQVVSVEK
jgi:type IV secretory pathway TrbF-like protein